MKLTSSSCWLLHLDLASLKIWVSRIRQLLTQWWAISTCWCWPEIRSVTEQLHLNCAVVGWVTAQLTTTSLNLNTSPIQHCLLLCRSTLCHRRTLVWTGHQVQAGGKSMKIHWVRGLLDLTRCHLNWIGNKMWKCILALSNLDRAQFQVPVGLGATTRCKWQLLTVL